MSRTASSCQYAPDDVQRDGLPLLYGETVSCVFDGAVNVTAVDRVDFSITENTITAIVGASGSGKSSLLKLIYGLLAPDSGEIRYRGWRVPTRQDKLIPGHDAMKLVSQGADDLNLYAKVWDNVASQLPNTNLSRKQAKTKEVLKNLQIHHLSEKRVADLSGGERQRVAIARALVNDPEVLLMDEPFNQVDAAFRDALQQDIRQIVSDTGLTVILVSHDPAEVLAMADQIIVMQDGTVIDRGAPRDLYYAATHPYTARLLAKANILEPPDAEALGIKTGKTVAILQEHIQITPNAESLFYIRGIRFRGLYSEYVVSNDQLTLHVVDPRATNLSIGTAVDLRIDRHHTFA